MASTTDTTLFLVYLKKNPAFTSISWVFKLYRAEPFEGWFSAPLLSDVDLLDEIQTGQYISNVVEPPHLSCKYEEMMFGCG